MKVFKIVVFLFCFFFLFRNSYAEFFVIKNYNIDVTVKKDAVLEIKEELYVNFTEERHGIFRKIPYIFKLKSNQFETADRPLSLSGNYKYDIYDVNVPGENVKIYKEGNYLIIRIGDPDKYVYGDKKYTIYYKVYGGINFFQNHSEFYWNLAGNQWEVPIEKVEAYVFLPTPIDLQEDNFFVYTGQYGRKETNAEYTFDGKVLSIKTLRPLNPYEAVTVGIKFPKDYLTQGSFFLNSWLFLVNNSIFFIPVIAFCILFTSWWLIGKDDSSVRMVYYKPPPDITPAEAGVVIDDNVENRDVISLLFYWAANGYMEIQEVEDETALIFKKKDYILVKLKDLPEDAKVYEKIMFNGLFPASTSFCKVSSLKDEFYIIMNMTKTALEQTIDAMKFYTSSRTIAKLVKVFAIIMGFVSFIVGMSYKRIDIVVSLLATSVIIFVFSIILPKKTSKGLKVFQILSGFKDFVKKVEKPRLEMLLKEDAAYFDKTLPYAIALGVGDKWAEKFENLIAEPPSWYKGYDYKTFSTVSFVNSINSCISNMNSVFTSAPPSAGSGGSGFSGGGGFAGGGGGGGGGGSW